MNFLFLISLFFVVFSDSTDELKIYVFEMGQAESQLILFPSGYSVLIDVGEDESDGEGISGADYVTERIEEIIGRREIDVLVLTHMHIDHRGIVNHGGAWRLMEEKGFKFNKFVDRNTGEYNGESRDDCSTSTIDWYHIGQHWTDITDWVCYSASTKDQTKLSKIREKADICSKTQIEPPDEGAEIEILLRDTKGVKDENGNVEFNGDVRDWDYPTAENDYSVAIRIKYGDFVYSTCGDLSGREYERDRGHCTFHDIESTVAPMMGEVDIYHANHHGLETSTNQFWLDTLKPTVTVISCDFYVPDSGVMGRITDSGSVIYTTNDCWDGSTNHYSENTIMYGEDIVITVPLHGDKYTISKKDGSDAKQYEIKKNKTPGECKKLYEE